MHQPSDLLSYQLFDRLKFVLIPADCRRGGFLAQPRRKRLLWLLRYPSGRLRTWRPVVAAPCAPPFDLRVMHSVIVRLTLLEACHLRLTATGSGLAGPSVPNTRRSFASASAPMLPGPAGPIDAVAPVAQAGRCRPSRRSCADSPHPVRTGLSTEPGTPHEPGAPRGP
jgi:hypothetical protein